MPSRILPYGTNKVFTGTTRQVDSCSVALSRETAGFPLKSDLLEVKNSEFFKINFFPGSGSGNWCVPYGTPRRETRTLPPVNAAGVVAPVAWTPPFSTTFSRDEGQCVVVAPSPCAVNEWSPWSTCTGTCGGTGSTTRTRSVIVDGPDCPPLTETNTCPMPACPTNGGKSRVHFFFFSTLVECKAVLFPGQPHETTVTISAVDLTKMKFTVSVKQHTGMVAIGFPQTAGVMTNADTVIGKIHTKNVMFIFQVGEEPHLPLTIT